MDYYFYTTLALAVAILKIFKIHILVIVVALCKSINGVIIKTKKGETRILKKKDK
ncbi:MAG: hypothetical protein GF353_29725 [Candidatus Lokiarchaeota archaeon]|nr:hypothetical protein [Candidatus Lokiarchaeota archaeon]